jgi:hypothetical protein
MPSPPARLAILTLTLSLSLTSACVSGSATADRDADAARFYEGRTITYLVASMAGGGYDTYARIIARYLEKQLPGTRVVVRNAAGARHLLGTNETFNAAPDGLTIGTFMVGGVYPQLAGAPGVRYDLSRMSWIGNAASEPRALAVTTRSGLRSLDDIRKRSSEPLSVVTGGVGTTPYFSALSLSEALGIPFKLVVGFTDNEGELALIRGDVEGTLTSTTSLKPMLDKGLAHVILSIGGSASSRETAALATSARGRTLMSMLEVQGLLARLTAGPPGIPADRLAVLRRAYSAALADPQLGAEFARANLPIEPLDADAVSVHIRRLFDVPPDVVAWLRSAGTP